MKKTTVVTLVSLGLLAGFVSLMYFGFKYSRGTPVAYQESEMKILEVIHLDKAVDLSSGFSEDIWESLPSQEIELMYQVTVLPWPKSLIGRLSVKSFHNQKDVYFYLSWQDDTENKTHITGKFSDACALMFPLEEEVKPSTIMMGFMQTTNIWQWKAQQDEEFWMKKGPTSEAYVDFYYPFEDEELFPVSLDIPVSAVNNLMAVRVGTITHQETQSIQGRGFWRDGVWHVVIKRALSSGNSDTEVSFQAPQTGFCAFGVWNGDKGDRGGRKSISEWVTLEIR